MLVLNVVFKIMPSITMIKTLPEGWEEHDSPLLTNRWGNENYRVTYDHSGDEVVIEQRYGVLWDEVNVIESDEVGAYPRVFVLGVIETLASKPPSTADIESLFKQLDREYLRQSGQFAGTIA